MIIHRARRAASRLPDGRQFIVWCLLVAVSIYGLSSTLAEMLGRQHVHRGVAVSAGPMQGWVDFRRAGHDAITAAPQRHAHGLFERHHHDAADDSVLALGADALTGAADESGNASGGSASLVLALAGTLLIAPASVSDFTWRLSHAEPVHGRAGGRLERPPKSA